MKIPKTMEELKAYRSAYVVSSMKIAQVTLRVLPNGFKDVLWTEGDSGHRGTLHKMDVADHPRVHKKDPNGLNINPGGATLRFTITPDDYIPIGITFVRKPPNPPPGTPSLTAAPSLTDDERLGLLNFDQIKISRDEKHTLDVTDNYMDEADDHQYKFSIIIQRKKTGAIGIIDPDIDHVPD